MIGAADTASTSKDARMAFLLKAPRSSGSRASAAEAEHAKTASDASALAAACDKKISDLASQPADTRREPDRLIGQIRLANTRFFGSRSEKVVPEQISLLNECEATSNADAPEPAVEGAPPKRRPRRRGGKPAVDCSKLETAVIDHELDPGLQACPRCAGELAEMAVEATKRIRIVPARLAVEEHRRHAHRCDSCCADNAGGGESKGAIVRAPAPKGPVPHSFAAPSLIARLISGEYVNSLPLYRMEAELGSLGASISRQNMANWMMDVRAGWLSKAHARAKAELLGHPRIHADETAVQALKEPGREARQKSRMRLFCAAGCDVPVYVFEHRETRGKHVARDFLRGRTGVLAADGCRPYFALGLPGTANVACAVRTRRCFAQIVEIAGGGAEGLSVASVALEARRRIDEVFAVDAQFDDMAPEARKRAREEGLRGPMEEFLPWAKARPPKASPGLALHKALSYAIEYWPYTLNALEDGHLEPSNNVAERARRIFVCGRRNWPFSDTPAGAHASAAIYGITATAKANGLNPRLCIEWLLHEMPNAGEPTDEAADGFLPWSAHVPDSARLSPKEAAKAKETKDEPVVDIDPYLENDETENNLRESQEPNLQNPESFTTGVPEFYKPLPGAALGVLQAASWGVYNLEHALVLTLTQRGHLRYRLYRHRETGGA